MPVATSFENGFIPTLDDMEAALTPKTRALLINSPCNPSGVVFDAATLDMLADFAVRHDLVVISDEVYDSIVFQGRPKALPRVRACSSARWCSIPFPRPCHDRMARGLRPRPLLDHEGND